MTSGGYLRTTASYFRAMTSSFDRRRANGPENTYPPLHNIKVSKSSSGIESVWNVDPHYALQNPKSICSDNLVLHTMKISDDDLEITRLAQENVSIRPDGRKVMESRSICKCTTTYMKRSPNRFDS